MPKFTKKESELKTILDKWVYFLKHAEDLEMAPKHADTLALQEAYEVATRFNWSKQELEVMEYWEMRERANRDAAFEKGKKEGEQNKALEVARKLLAEGLDPTIVVKTTGISLDDLATL